MLQGVRVVSLRGRVRSEPQRFRGPGARSGQAWPGGVGAAEGLGGPGGGAAAGEASQPLSRPCPRWSGGSEPPVSGWQHSPAQRPRAPEGGARRGSLFRRTPSTLPRPGGRGPGLARGLGAGAAWEAPAGLVAPSLGPPRAGHPPLLSREPLERRARGWWALTDLQRHSARRRGLERRATELPSAPFSRLSGPGPRLLRGRGSGCTLLADVPRPRVWWGRAAPAGTPAAW